MESFGYWCSQCSSLYFRHKSDTERFLNDGSTFPRIVFIKWNQGLSCCYTCSESPHSSWDFICAMWTEVAATLETMVLVISCLAGLPGKCSPCQRWRAGWFVQSFICWNPAFRGALRAQVFLIKWESCFLVFFFIINNAAHSVLWSLDPSADSKKGVKILLSHKSQAPLEITVYFSQWQKEDLKFEMRDLIGVFLLLWVFLCFCYPLTICYLTPGSEDPGSVYIDSK